MSELTPEAISRAQPRLLDGVEQESQANGHLILRGPVLRRGPIALFFAKVFRRPERITVELDDIGAFVVERLDGRSLGELAQEVSGYLKLSRREAEAALTTFLRMLLKRRLIDLGLERQ